MQSTLARTTLSKAGHRAVTASASAVTQRNLTTLHLLRQYQPRATQSVTRVFRPTAFFSSSSSSHLSTPIVSSPSPSTTITSTQVHPYPQAAHTGNSNPHDGHSSHNSPPPPPPPPPEAEPEGITQRLRALFRKHGWSALVIYLVLGTIDFSLAFVAVYTVGADRVREAEDWVLDKLEWRRKDGEPGKIKKAVTSRVDHWKEQHGRGKKVIEPAPVSSKKEENNQDGVVDVAVVAQKAAEKGKASGYNAIATTAVLAYAIHKTALLPFRLGVTVWATPRVVRRLQAWGWKVGMNTTGVASIARTPKPKPRAA